MVDFVPFLCPERERERERGMEGGSEGGRGRGREREREREKERFVWWGRGKKEVFIGGRVEP
jgi:hypothetical protein